MAKPVNYTFSEFTMSDDDELQRTQKERQEYVKNIGIEYRFGCYEVGACGMKMQVLKTVDFSPVYFT